MSLEKARIALNAQMREGRAPGIDVRAQLVVALAYIVAVLTVPILNPGALVWMLCYPIIMAEAFRLGYGRLAVRSLWVLPLVLLIGIFNPMIDKQPLWHVCGVVVSRGWVMCISVTLRGLLTVQALLLLVSVNGFDGLCRAMAGIGVPKVLVTQLLMMYRYLGVLIDEAIAMHRSRQSRGFGRKNYPLGMWGVFVGQLLMRSIRRSQRISMAMTARGFSGDLCLGAPHRRLHVADWGYMAGWLAVIAMLRFVDMPALFDRLF